MPTTPSPRRRTPLASYAPGVLVCLAIVVLAALLQQVEARLAGRAWIEALVLAILLGTALRTWWYPGPRFDAGIRFCAKIPLEVAIVLLGATVDERLIRSGGVGLLFGIVGVVFLAIACSFALGRLFGLSGRMAMLIACGNSICGNSAIAAVAPVIDAHPEDVGASIAFTAVLGVGVVLLLPVLARAWHMGAQPFGVLAGLTVYAVPQVLAATAPISSAAAQIGTYVKLVRVLMLGPVVLVLSLLARRGRPRHAAGGSRLAGLLPWFIVGFLLMLGLRAVGAFPLALLRPTTAISGWLTVVSMAALGLGTDLRAVARAGPRVTAVVTLSLLVLGGLALGLLGVLARGG
jgi:uncharacterized integral membrane protein (TIGR00698 family)